MDKVGLAINEDHLNHEAAQLEICRNEIFIEIERDLALQSSALNLKVLLEKLENYLFKKNYQTLRKRLSSVMISNSDIPDYKVEMYLRNYIIDPLMEDNYQRLLNLLKSEMTTKFIKQFPITTTVLETSTVGVFKLGRDGKAPVDMIYSTLAAFLPTIDVSKNFDMVSQAIYREVNYFESQAYSTPANAESLKKLAQDSSFVVRTLEFNCGVLLDICCRILDSIIVLYNCGLFKSEIELEKLRKDFKEHMRKKIIEDSRTLGKLSPKSLNSTLDGICKDVWTKVKHKINTDLEVSRKNKVILTFQNRANFKKSFFKLFRDEVEGICMQKLKIAPREDVFLYTNYTQVSSNIDILIDESFSHMVSSLKDVSEALKHEIVTYLNNMLQPTTQYQYKHFQIIPNMDINQIMSPQTRKAIIMMALVSAPKTLNEQEYVLHLNHIRGIALTLQVPLDAELSQVFHMTSSIKVRQQNMAQLMATKYNLEHIFDRDYVLDIHKISYMIFGLYFVVSSGDQEIAEMRRAIETNQLINFRPVDYKRRRLLFQIIRFLKNGHFHVLNYNIVLLIEMFVERHRNTYNNYLAKKVLNNNTVPLTYTFDYNQVIKDYRTMPLSDLARLAQGMGEIAKMGEVAKVGEEAKRDPSAFKSNFISDLQFTEGKVVVNNENIPMLTVDKLSTVEHVLRTPSMKGKTKSSELIEKSALTSSQFFPQPELKETLSTPQSDELKFHGKLQYLKDNIKKLEIISLQKDPNNRSRCPILCLSGFMSEDSKKLDDWSQMVQLYPFTEVLTINWDAITATGFLTASANQLRKVSLGALAGKVFNELHGIVTKKNMPAETQNNLEDRSARENPFEEITTEEDQSGVQVEGPNPQPLSKESGGGFFSLVKMGKLREAFSSENLTMVALNLAKATGDIQIKDNIPNGANYVPGFAVETGIWDFYRNNPFNQAYHHAVLSGQMLALMISRSNVFNSNVVSPIGFSLGSVLTYSACCTLYDLGCKDKIGDVCLIGSTVDLMSFGQNLHKLIGTKGVVQGKLTVCFTVYDGVLAYLFRTARVGESPIGLKRINQEYLLTCLRENDPELKTYTPEALKYYLSMKFDNVDVSNKVTGHTDYKFKLTQIMPSIDFNSDLQFFKERS